MVLRGGVCLDFSQHSERVTKELTSNISENHIVMYHSMNIMSPYHPVFLVGGIYLKQILFPLKQLETTQCGWLEHSAVSASAPHVLWMNDSFKNIQSGKINIHPSEQPNMTSDRSWEKWWCGC